MPPENPSADELVRLTGQVNDLANRLLLTEQERSYILKKAGMQAHGEQSSKDLERLGESVGPHIQMLLEELVEVRWKDGAFLGYGSEEIDRIRQGLEETRLMDWNLSGL